MPPRNNAPSGNSNSGNNGSNNTNNPDNENVEGGDGKKTTFSSSEWKTELAKLHVTKRYVLLSVIFSSLSFFFLDPML